jgi:hypothetical protein
MLAICGFLPGEPGENATIAIATLAAARETSDSADFTVFGASAESDSWSGTASQSVRFRA